MVQTEQFCQGHTFTDHLAGSTRNFKRLTDNPVNAIFGSLIWMHSGVATGFDESTKDKVGKEPFGDMSDTDCYGLTRSVSVKYRNDTV